MGQSPSVRQLGGQRVSGALPALPLRLWGPSGRSGSLGRVAWELG